MRVRVQYSYTEGGKIRFRCITDHPEHNNAFLNYANRNIFNTLRELNQELNEYFASIDQSDISIILDEHR